VVAEGVVGAPGQVDGDPFLHGSPARGDGAAGGAARPLDQFGRPGQADAPDLLGRELAGFDPL